MSKWTKIVTINDATIQTSKSDREVSKTFNKLMATTPKRDIEQLKKHSEDLFDIQQAEDEKLLDAFAKKKVKSKAAIKKALGLSKKRNDAGKDKDKKANLQDNIVTEG